MGACGFILGVSQMGVCEDDREISAGAEQRSTGWSEDTEKNENVNTIAECYHSSTILMQTGGMIDGELLSPL